VTTHPSAQPGPRTRRPLRAALASLTAALLIVGGSFAGATAATADALAPDSATAAATASNPAAESPAPGATSSEAPAVDAPAAAPTAAPQAAAAVAAPVLTVTPAMDVDPAVSNAFTVTGTGYVGDAAVNGAYVVLGEKAKWAGEGPLPAEGWAALSWVMPRQIVDGKFTTTLTIPAGTFDPSKAYHLGTSAAHGLSITNRSLDAFAAIGIRQPAPVADPELTVTPTADIDPAEANTFTVTGTGFVGPGAASGAYVVLGEKAKWSGEGALPATGWAGLAWVMPRQIVDGKFTTTLTIPAGTFDPSKAYHVGTSAAHGLSVTNRSLDAFADLSIRQPAPVADPKITVTPASDVDPAVENTFTVTGTGFVGDAAVNGAYVVLGEKSTWAGEGPLPSAGWAALSWVMPRQIVDGKFTTTLTIPAGTFDPSKDYHVATSAAHGLSITNRTLDSFAGLSIRQPVPVAPPKITVTPASAIDPAVENTFTVKGTGFTGEAAASGAYVLLGDRAIWSGNGPLKADGWLSTNWVMPRQIVDGAFTLTIKIPAGALAYGVDYQVATSAAHGLSVTNRSLDTFQQLTLVPQPAKSTSTTLAASATSISVGDSVRFDLTVSPAVDGTVTLLDGFTVLASDVPVRAGSGSFSTSTLSAGVHSITVRFLPNPSTGLEPSTSNRVTISVSSIIPPQPTTPPTPPTTPTTPTAPVSDPTRAGSLSWGVVSSFRAYITGSIAKGSIQVSGGATSSGGAFQFGQSNGSFDLATNTGSAGYSGAVRFTGHGGALDVTLANPQIQVTSATAGTLSATVNGTPTTLATLDLQSSARSTTGNSVTYRNAPVTFTAAGSEVFQGRYPTGDPLTFTIGVAGAAPAGTAGTVAQASGAGASASTTPRLPATAPASTGIVLTDETRAKLIAGDEVTVSADGFQPNEKNIRVVVYSTPTVLASGLGADASGVVTWTGKLPATLEPGQHTLTFQGSTSKGVVFELPEVTTLAAGSCLVENATLDWGFKESFRNYIEGIARGGWELADGATYTYPTFGFTGGKGSYNPEESSGVVSFAGSIRFTGHDGALNTTLTNPQIEFVDDTTAYILLDVSGTTQDGQTIADTAIRFAKLDLGSGTVNQDAGSVTGADIAAVLTDEGAAAFGTYAAGEELDPVAFTVPLPADCGVAAAPAAEEEAEVTTTDTQAELAAPAASTGDTSWIVWAIVAVFVLLAALALVWLLIARRRSASGAAASGSGSSSASNDVTPGPLA